jgi:hypothetical protein
MMKIRCKRVVSLDKGLREFVRAKSDVAGVIE